MAVYDDQDIRTRQDDKELDDLNSLTGISPDEEQAMEDRAITDDMAEREGLDAKTGGDEPKADTKGKSSTDKSEDSDPEIPFNDGGESKGKKRRFRGVFNRKTAIGGGVVGLLIGGGFGLFGIMSGPLQIIHFSQLLQQFHFSNNDEFANGRTSKYLYHRARTGSRGHAKMQTRLGTVGNRVANVMEIKLQREAGLRSLYDTSTGTLVGYEIVDENKAINTLIDADINPDAEFDITEGRTPNVIGVDGNTETSGRVLRLRVDANGNTVSMIKRRGFHKSITKTLKMNRIANSLGFRKSAQRGGLDLHPIRRADARVNETFVQLARRLTGRWSEESKNGARPTATPDIRGENADADGSVSTDAEDVDRAGRDAKIDADSGDKPGSRARTAGRLAAGAAIGVGTLCAARSISNNIDAIKHANIIMPLMRMGTRWISLGAQTMAGQDVREDMLGVASQTLYSEEFGSWASARSIQAEQGQELTGPDIPGTAKPSRVNEKPMVLNIIDTIFDRAGAFGSAACSRIGQWALGAVTGGLISTVVGEVIGGVASAAGVNPMDMFAEWIVNTLAGDMVDVAAEGADLGNMANYGARLAANEQALSMGGARLSSAQAAALDNDSRNGQLHEFQQKKFFARVFDVYEPKSVASKMLFENQNVAMATVTPGKLFGNLTNIGSFLASSFTNALTPAASAQSSTYDYGFDEYGFTLEEQEDPRFEDPYENARIVESELGLEYLNEHYGECFSTNINPQTGVIEGDETMDYNDIPEMCHDRNNTALQRYRFYIADTVLLKSLDCYEGTDESACTEIGFNGTGTEVTPISRGDNNEVPQGGFRGVDTSAQQCPSGSTDLNVIQVPTGEGLPANTPQHSIRLCGIPEIPGGVNVAIAQNVANMIAAARAEGVSLSGSSFRTSASQISLRRSHCGTSSYAVWEMPSGQCRPPTARPGRSMHEQGLAIDFSNCSSRGTACYQWLNNNAANFGLRNLPSEPWHWSTTGN